MQYCGDVGQGELFLVFYKIAVQQQVQKKICTMTDCISLRECLYLNRVFIVLCSPKNKSFIALRTEAKRRVS